MNVTNNHTPLNVLSISAAYKRNGRLLSVAQSLQAVEPLLARFGVEPYCKRQHNSNEPCKSQYQCFHILNFLEPCCQHKRTGMLFFYTSKRTPFKRYFRAFQPQILYQVSDEILALAFEHIDYRNLNHCVASRLLAH